MDEFKYVYKLVSLATYSILVCLFSEYLYVNIDHIGMGTILYLLASFLFSQIIAIQDIPKARTNILMRNFILASLCLGYIYIASVNRNALVLFYILILREVLTVGRRCTHIMFFCIVLEFLGLDYFMKPSLDFDHIAFSVVNSIFLFIVGIMAQRMWHMFQYEQQQHKKIEELLRQMESGYQQMSESVKKDSLTGLYNHKTFFDHITNVDFKQTAVIMIDIDYFKTFNDKYGHLCGDYVLRELSRVIADNVRSCDEVFRYGGEEFAVILQNITSQELEYIALRIRRSVENHSFIYEEEVLPNVTISIGYAAYVAGNIDAADPLELIRSADKSLYVAKDNGRNSVCCNGKVLLEA